MAVAGTESAAERSELFEARRIYTGCHLRPITMIHAAEPPT